MIIYILHSDLVTENEVDEKGNITDQWSFKQKATNAGELITSWRGFTKKFNTGQLDGSLIFISND